MQLNGKAFAWRVQGPGVYKTLPCTRPWRVLGPGVYKALECIRSQLVQGPGMYKALVCAKCQRVQGLACASKVLGSILGIRKKIFQTPIIYSCGI